MSDRLDLAQELMSAFADRTGLTSDVPERRYLWTDAFAVCNYLGLAEETGEEGFRELAEELVQGVHRVLGRHREDDPREGWISGLGEEGGARHPTAGGLRIGKKLPERGADEPMDSRREWDRDGQYFHYLTRWMHALQRLSRAAGDAEMHRWARELAKTAHEAFTVEGPRGRLRMVWKMSIDLSRPLVPTMGHHDPLDGLVTYLDLQSVPVPESSDAKLPDLEREIEEATRMCAGRGFVTEDPLGIGGLLIDVVRLARLVDGRGIERDGLLLRLLSDSVASLGMYAGSGNLELPPSQRLPFRELGLAIGLRGLALLDGMALPERATRAVEVLDGYLPLAEQVESTWLETANRGIPPWLDHEDINSVMLATALAPAGYLGD